MANDSDSSSDLSDLEILESIPLASTSGTKTRPTLSTSNQNGKTGGAGGGKGRKDKLVLTDETTKRLDDGIKTNWEVAYVYAYLMKFTDLHSLEATDSILQSITDFETALVTSSPTNGQVKTARLARQEIERERRKLEEEKRAEREKILKQIAIQKAAKLEGDAMDVDDDGAEEDVEVLETNDADDVSSLSSLSDAEGPATIPLASTSALAIDGEAITPAVVVDAPIIPAPPPSDLITLIIQDFRATLAPIEVDTARAKREKAEDWFTWLTRWVKMRLEGLDPARDPSVALKWERNWLERDSGEARSALGATQTSSASEEERWWKVSWQDKVHLMRILADFSLAFAPGTRKMVDDGYVIGKQKIYKRSAADNPLIIEPLGYVNQQSIWMLDSTPRLYSLEKVSIARPKWRVLTTTLDEYEFYISTLANPADDKAKAIGSFFKNTKAAAKRAKAAKEGKGKGKVVDTEEEEENEEKKSQYSVRSTLEKRIGAIKQAQEMVIELAKNKIIAAEEERIEAEKAIARDARLARDAALLAEIEPKATRQRTAAAASTSYESAAVVPRKFATFSEGTELLPGTRSSRAGRVSYVEQDQDNGFDEGDEFDLEEDRHGEVESDGDGVGRKKKKSAPTVIVGKKIGKGKSASSSSAVIEKKVKKSATKKRKAYEDDEDDDAGDSLDEDEEKDDGDESTDDDDSGEEYNRGRSKGKTTKSQPGKKNGKKSTGARSRSTTATTTASSPQTKKAKSTGGSAIPEWRGERRSTRTRLANEHQEEEEVAQSNIGDGSATNGNGVPAVVNGSHSSVEEVGADVTKGANGNGSSVEMEVVAE